MRSALALTIALVLTAPASADDAAQARKDHALQLDQLFAQLHTSGSPDDAKATELKIWMIWGLDNTDEAVQALNHASVAMQAGDNAEAEGTLGDLIAAHPEFSEAWNRRATLYYEMGRYQASLDDIDHVLALEPRHFGALSGKGLVLHAMGRDAEAIKALKEALAVNPNMAAVKANLAAIEQANPSL
jgi:tetratricopeptide (TPR) repeat protein